MSPGWDPVSGDLDRPREACGVFGIYARGADVARIAFFALYALQHRGQESAGIATCDGHAAYIHKGMGLVSQVFNEENLRPLRGHLAIGHNRYSTTGSSHIRNAQPYLIETMHGPLGVGHNGNLTNAATLRRKLLERGVGLMSSSDSEVITQMLAAPPPGGEPDGPDWEARIAAFMAEAEGAYSLVILTRDAVFAVRDPWGFRPLCLGELPGNGHPGYVVASESCALGTIGARYLREVRPGEIVRLDSSGVHSLQGRPPAPRAALCVFEYVYFARPDSVLEGQTIHRVRQRLGEELAREAPADADMVVGVPDSATPAAIGYARASGIPYNEGLTKNRYIGRTFIQPSDRLRRAGVYLKYNPLTANLKGKRIVLIDDSIVRGNTAGPLVRMLRESGAVEVHVRVSSPPVRHPCFMGVDMATHEELIAYRMSVEEIRQHIGADSLAYLSYEGMMRAVTAEIGEDRGHCSACFTGEYPIPLNEWWQYREQEKRSFEGIWGA
ncbi:MAG: amidophosphoribosyltransferase [Anaerolineae bacterium]|nr:amidophosphoribosyltransferase [Anaerolineae bacterium]